MSASQALGRDLPVASSWYATREVSDGLTVIWEPQVDPLLRANIWHLRGVDRTLVVDSGLGVVSLRTALPDLFDEECVLVVTHGHLDHMGSAHEFRQCWAHPAERLESPAPGTLRADRLGQLLGLELDSATPELLIDALPHAGYDVDGYSVRPARVTRELRDGDRIELSDRTLTVLHLPGHTPGSIALHDRSARALFSGDIVYDLAEGECLLDELHGSDIDSYVATMHRLLALDIDIVHPGHGESFDGARLRELAGGYLALRDR